MSPRDEIFSAISFDASYDEANEPLIAAGDSEAEDDQRLEETVFSRFKFSTLLLGLLAGFFMQFSILGAHLLVIILSGEDLDTKPKINIVVFSLFWSFFTAASLITNLRFLCNLVTITYSAVGGRSKDLLLEEMILHIRFGVGVCLAWTTSGVLLGMRAQTELSLVILVVALVWCTIV
jgi:hypothetical protein